MPVLQYYRWPALNEHAIERLVERARAAVPGLRAIESEWCFNVESASGAPDAAALAWLFSETFEPEQFGARSELARRAAAADGAAETVVLVEVGPRMTFASAWSTNAVSICGEVATNVQPQPTK